MDALLSTPISELKRPLAVDSKILGEIIYLVADERMAKEVEAQGKVAYLPEEVKALLRQFREMETGDWMVFLKTLHNAKKTFLEARIQA